MCSWQNVQKQKTSLELGTLWTKGKIIIETDKKKHGGQTRRQMVFHCILASTQNLQTMCENIWIYICKKDTKSSGIAGICGLFVCVRGERCPGKERWDTIAAVLNIEWGEWWWNFIHVSHHPFLSPFSTRRARQTTLIPRRGRQIWW